MDSNKSKLNKEGILDSNQVIPTVEANIVSDYMISPITFTLARYNGDTTKIKLMVTLIDKLQDYFKNILKGNKPKQLALFSDDPMNHKLRIAVDFRDVCEDPHRYVEIKKLIVELARMPIELPVKDLRNNMGYIKYTTFCTILFPKERWGRNFFVEIDKDVADVLMNIQEFGYQKYLKNVIMTSHSRYTQRFYMLITAWKDLGSISYSVLCLRQLLQLDHKYDRWASFYKRVILTAENELYALFQASVSECYFKTTLIYPKGASKRGEPTSIRFDIILSEQELQNMSVTNIAYKRILCERKMQQLGVNKTNINKFMKQVSNDYIAELDTALVKLQAKIQREITTITSTSHYATEAIRHFLSDLKTKQKGKSAPKALLPAADVKTQSPYMEEEKRFKVELQDKLNKEVFDTWIHPIQIGLIEQAEGQCKVSLNVPSQFFAFHVDENYGKELNEALTHVLDTQILLKYNFKS